jgi:hypothetical protein
MAEFKLTNEEDTAAIELAIKTARQMLRKREIDPSDIVGLGHALFALQRMPAATPGADVQFDVNLSGGDSDFRESSWISFRITSEEFEIREGGSSYSAAVGGDSHSQTGWCFNLEGEGERNLDLVELEDGIAEMIQLGANVEVEDQSEMEI